MLHSFIDDVSEARGMIAPEKMSDALRITRADLARLAKVHRNTLSQRGASPEVQERLGEIATIIAAAAELTGDTGRAILWFKFQPLAGFDNKTAADLVAMGGAKAVIAHLETLADGGFA